MGDYGFNLFIDPEVDTTATLFNIGNQKTLLSSKFLGRQIGTLATVLECRLTP